MKVGGQLTLQSYKVGGPVRNLNEENTFLNVLPNYLVDGFHLTQAHCRSMLEFIQELEFFSEPQLREGDSYLMVQNGGIMTNKESQKKKSCDNTLLSSCGPIGRSLGFREYS